jgi:N-acetylglutamate synthase-like GNAT family acetyltransferase
MERRTIPVVAETSYRIRPARRGDREGIANLLAEIGYLDACDTATLSWVISHPEMEVHIAVDSLDRAVGMVSLSHRPQLRLKGRIATIDELVVSSAWRGRGIGRELLTRAITRCKVLGCKRLQMASLSRQSAGKLFTRLGFVEVDAALFRLAELESNR